MVCIVFLMTIWSFQGCGQSQPAGSGLGRSTSFSSPEPASPHPVSLQSSELPCLLTRSYKGLGGIKLQEEGHCSDQIKKFKDENCLTPGSVLLIESGALASRGIKYVIRAAIGAIKSRTTAEGKIDIDFEPSVRNVENSIKNARSSPSIIATLRVIMTLKVLRFLGWEGCRNMIF